SFEYDDDPTAGVLHPVLQMTEVDLELVQFLLIGLALHPGVAVRLTGLAVRLSALGCHGGTLSCLGQGALRPVDRRPRADCRASRRGRGRRLSPPCRRLAADLALIRARR